MSLLGAADWPRCRDWIVSALQDATEAELLADLITNHAQLWPGEKAAMVTRIENTAEGRFLHVWLAGGELSELLAMAPGMEAWGRQQGCNFASIHGRKGWLRVLGKRGWVEADGELRKALR